MQAQLSRRYRQVERVWPHIVRKFHKILDCFRILGEEKENKKRINAGRYSR